jgi:WD40 repeat protein
MCSLTFQKNGSWPVYACKFAPDGKIIVSASGDKTLKIWDVSSGTCQATLEGHRYLLWSLPLRGKIVTSNGFAYGSPPLIRGEA